MFSSTGINLQDLLQKHGMLVLDDEDEEMTSLVEYGYEAEDPPRPPTEIMPELADSGWIQRERAMGKVSQVGSKETRDT